MSVEYWIDKPCPECGGKDGCHELNCRMRGIRVMSREAIPLRWLHGLVPDEMMRDLCLISKTHKKDRFYVDYGYSVGRDEKYIPLSAILELIQEE